MKKKTWRSAVALLLAVQMAVASGVTAMAQTSAAVGADSPAAVMVAEDAEQDEAVRYLSDMELAKASVGWGELMRDKGLEELPLKLRTADGTQTYSKGLCAHAPSELVVDVEGRGAQRFQAYVGVNYSKNGGSCGFVVKADDQELFNVAKIKESDTQQRVDVEIPAGTKKLTLITTDGGDGKNSDHSVWADAKLLLDASVQKNLHRVTASAGKAMLEVGEATAVSLKGTLVNDSEADLSAADITYTSSDEKVATVDDKGVITGVSNGLVTITCEATLDGITKSASVDLIIGNEVEGKVWSIASPDGEVASVFMLGSEGNLSYSVQRENKSVLGFSAMGMNTSVGDFTEGLEFNGVTDAKTVDETYSVNSRKKEEYRNHYTERTISFTKEGVSFDVIVRAYDDGIAFRYVIKSDGDEISVHDEATAFRLPAKSNVWAMGYGSGNFSYESHFNKYTAESVSGNQSIPLLFETPDGTFGMISEADIAGYMGTMVKADNGVLKISATPQQSDDPVVDGSFAFPWRFAVVGTLGDVNENTMTENLSPDPAEGDYSWAKPGVTSWTWLVGGASMQHDPEAINKYVDFASEMGWSYYIMDEGWQPRSNQGDGSRYYGEFEWYDEVRQHAEEKGVGLIAWVHCDDLNTKAKRDARLPHWKEIGIKGIKVDFFDRENQDRVQLMQDLYEDCEKLGLVVNVHGANKPTGEVRTHPGILTREGIYGQEMGDLKAEQYTILPFTRNAVGPADVTETIYPRGSSTTSGFQVALSVLITSGLHCLASSVEDYQSSPALSFYKDLPVVWDDTKFIDGYPGEYSTLARRSGDKWYGCSITVDARDAEFPLDFLDDGQYYALVYSDDGTDSRGLKMEIQQVTKGDTLTVPMKKGGGCAVILSKEKPSAAETIEFAQDTMTLERNAHATIETTITPEKPLISSLVWTSSNPSVATVDGGGKVTALRPGTAVITATSPVDASVSDSCTVTVEMEKYTLDRNTWNIQRENGQYISYPGATSMKQFSLSGDIDGNPNSEPQNFVYFPLKDQDFTATVKVSGDLKNAFQTVSLTAYESNKNAVCVMRRYHSNFGGNVFELMRYEGGYDEPHTPDTNPGDVAWLKLEKKGDVFTGYYSYDNENWVKIEQRTASKVAASDHLRVGVLTTNGSNNNNGTDILIEDFTYYAEGGEEGRVIPFAVGTESAIVDVAPVTATANVGTAFADLQLPATVKATLVDGTQKDLAVTWAEGDYDGSKAGTYTLEGTITLADGVMNLMDLKASATVTVAESTTLQGSGTKEDPFLVSSAHELDLMRNYSLRYNSAYFSITEDIDLGGSADGNAENWTPLGTESLPFSGKVNGNGHTISGLYINDADARYVGLFGSIENSTVENLTVEVESITSKLYAGGLAGYANNCSFVNCGVTAASADSKIVTTGSDAGGLIGVAVGLKGNNFDKCYASIDVEASALLGGLIGSYSGNNYSEIKNCYATGNVTAVNPPKNGQIHAGGLIGNAQKTRISNSFATGDVTAMGLRVGGLAGTLSSTTSETGWVKNSYASGVVSAGEEPQWAGGLIGVYQGADAVLEDAYYNNAMSVGCGYLVNDGLEDTSIGKTAEELASRALALELNANTANHESWAKWGFEKDVNNGYPVITGVGVGADVDEVTDKPVEPQSVAITYNSKNVTLKVNGEPQKLADLTGKYVAKAVESGTEIELTFEPRVENCAFRSVTVNGEMDLITGNAYTYTITMKDEALDLNFVFELTNKSILKLTYDYATKYVKDGTVDELVSDVKDAFMAAYDAAKDVLDDPAATQAEINEAWSDLIDVIHYLDFKPGDKSALEDLYNSLKVLSEENFTTDSWKPFAEALAQAAEVVADKEALEGDISKAYDDLLDAFNNLEEASKLDELAKLIEKAEAVKKEIEAGKYLPDGQEAFFDALEAAKAVDKDSSQSEVSEAAHTLTLTMAMLRKKADKSELEKTLEELKALDPSDYTAESYAAVAEAIEAMEKVMENDDLDNEEGQKVVDNAVKSGLAAQAKLEEVKKPTPSKGGNKGGSSASASNSYGTSGVVAAGQGVAVTGAYVVSDTTVNFTLKHGQAYCFKMTVVNGNTAPSFTVGNGSVLKTQFVAKIGNDYYYRVYAIGAPGQSTGVYTTLPGQNAVKHCAVTIG